MSIAEADDPRGGASRLVRPREIVAGGGTDQPLQFEAMAMRAVAIAADRYRRAFRHLGEHADSLARVGLLHLGTVSARVGIPGLCIVEVVLPGPAQQFWTGRHGRQPHVHEIALGVALL